MAMNLGRRMRSEHHPVLFGDLRYAQRFCEPGAPSGVELDRDHGTCSSELRLGNVRYADMADLPLPLKVDKRADRILDWYPIVDRMLKVDTLEPQPLQAVRTSTAQMLGSTISDPTVGSGPQKPALSHHHQPCRIWIERLGDQCFADTGTIRVGGIDKRDASLHRPPKQCYRPALISWRASDLRAGNAHRSKANLPNWQLGESLRQHFRPPPSAFCDGWRRRPYNSQHPGF